ncbi:MAG: hypothetical protein COB85_05145 [Bacteroidetes bacterium]|nr:MAG: hypothetical protein COB85_05145 [Bacteroidota bacterium]
MNYLQKNWLTLLIYLSLVFLAIALSHADYLVMPEIMSPGQLSISFAFLFFGFILNAAAWKNILNGAAYPISFGQSVASTGLAVFGKYIPGKLWAMVGQAGLVAKKYSYPISAISGILINAQLITIWVGLILSLIAIIGFGGYGLEVYAVISILVLIIFILIFSQLQKVIVEIAVSRVIGSDIEYVSSSIKSIWITALLYTIAWLSWCIGFYFLVVSLSAYPFLPFVGLGMALALTFGFLAIIIPGGLGVREAVLFGWLSLAGIDPVTSTTISVASRLWFLIGELFIFALAILLKRSN